MLFCVCGCHWLVLVAWIWSNFTYQALARPQQAAGTPTTLLKGFYANSSISSLLPLTKSGSCWKCGIEAPGGIRLVYWQPDIAADGGSNVTLEQRDAQPYTQVENSFTYTSPSVYVIYSSLRGTAACSTESGLYAVGPSFAEKTIAYSSRFLAYGTLSIADAGCSEFVVVDGFHTIDFSSLYYNPITTTTTYKAGCAPFVNPRLSLPHELTNVDPRWGDCEPLFYGAFDPPSVLTKASGGLAPSPVDAGQITQPAVVQPVSELAPAEPAVTVPPHVAAPTDAAGNNNPWPQANGKPDAQELPTPIANAGLASVVNQAPTPQPHVDEVNSVQMPQNEQGEKTPSKDQAGSVPAASRNPEEGHAQASASPQGAPPNQPSGSLGKIINSPFVPEQSGANPAVNSESLATASPVSPESDSPAIPPSHVAIPVQLENGRPAYAVVEAEPTASQGSAAQFAVIPSADASSIQTPAINGQKQSDATGAQPTPNPGGTEKVTLNDGTTADIPAANIIQPLQPHGDQAGAEAPQPGLQSVQLKSGAFVPLPGVNGAPSSIAVKGGNYLLPKPTEGTPQQTLTLLNDQTTAVPLVAPSQAVSLQGGSVTKVPINALVQSLTREGGEVSALFPGPDSTFTLADGQVTAVPGANTVAEANDDSTHIPLQILTLPNGEVTTVPIQIPARTFTLQGGRVTDLPADAPPEVLTLANDQVSTVSSLTLTAATLADGSVTSIAVGDPIAGSDDSSSNSTLQTLTLENGQVTAVPVAAPSQAVTLRGGKVTTLAANSPPQTLTLANGETTTVSPKLLSILTLANGEVTSIPAISTPSLASEGDFLTIPDAAISGKVHYTRLPIVQIQNAGSDQTQNRTIGQSNSSNSNSFALATVESVSKTSTTTSDKTPTPSGAISNAIASATPSSSKTSPGHRIWSNWEWRDKIAFAAFAMGLVLA